MRSDSAPTFILFGSCWVILGNKRVSHLLAEFPGRLSRLFLKDFGEVGAFLIAQLLGDLRDSLIGCDQKVFSLGELSGLNDLRDTLF